MKIANDAYVLVPAEELTVHPDNPNIGDERAISESIAANGFYGYLVVQKSSNHILAGNHRFKAGVAQGIGEFPVIFVDVDDATARRILLADNRTSDLGSLDVDAIVEILEDLAEAGEELTGTGYSENDLKMLQKSLEPPPPPKDKPPKKNKEEDVLPTVCFAFGNWQGGDGLDFRFDVPKAAYDAWIDDMREQFGFAHQELERGIGVRLGLDEYVEALDDES